jgi:phosphopantothenoylcysteine synthetase/decarboxylase
MRFLDVPKLRGLTGHPVRDDYKQPDDPDVLPDADAFVVAPATFNTVNKLAAGISDTLALGLANEAIGFGKPVVLAPWPNLELVKHFAFARSVELFAGAGVRFVPRAAGRPASPDASHGGGCGRPTPAPTACGICSPTTTCTRTCA